MRFSKILPNITFNRLKSSLPESLTTLSSEPYQFPWVANDQEGSSLISSSESLIGDSQAPRYNDFGIQMISRELFKQLFPSPEIQVDDRVIKMCLSELKKHSLLTKQTPAKETKIHLPKLMGSTVQEHFYNIGREQSEPYKELLLQLVTTLPSMPETWEIQPGWTRYSEEGIKRVDFPLEDAIVFDVEVCCSVGPLPILATAVSSKAWYGWVSKSLVDNVAGRKLKNGFTMDNLIPLETSNRVKGNKLPQGLMRPKIVVGHNVSYDRARVKEQYWLQRTGLRFIDTMSLHICVSGITSYQKAVLKAGIDDEEWSKVSSLNSLSKVYELYCKKRLSKKEQELFINGTIEDIRVNFQSSMTYCAKDVEATYFVVKEVFPMFLDRFPHPVTLAGMLELQSAYIPINENWNKYLADSQSTYEDLDMEEKCLLSQSANDACQLLHNEAFKKDLWLWDQDWSVKPLNLKKSKTKSSPEFKPQEILLEKTDFTDENMDFVDQLHRFLELKFAPVVDKVTLLPVRTPVLAGYPAWYRKLCEKTDVGEWAPQPNLVSTSKRIVPKLLQLTWKSMPIHHEKGHGWGYLVPYTTNIQVLDREMFPLDVLEQFCHQFRNMMCTCSESEFIKTNHHTRSGEYFCSKKRYLKQGKMFFCRMELGRECGLIKLPHKDGGHLNVGNPLARDFINKFSDNELSGSSTLAKRVIEISRMLSYWKMNRERIESQLICWLTHSDIPNLIVDKQEIGVILPQMVVCGTLTRRAVEPTWMTASNAIVERVGSELRGMVQAPPGYCLVGADVDAQELWIASLLGDAYCARSHGATPFSWMALNGQKRDGTDMHSVTAKVMGISRNQAKVVNYARIYGAGQRFAERLLKQFNTDISTNEAAQKAAKMMSLTKGKRMVKLRDNVLLNIRERTISKEAARELCSIHQKEMDELFEDASWVGGTESAMFNALESIASQAHPETPFLKSRLSRALEPCLDNESKYSPTRINWVVQSGAVDFLHLMLVSMRWFLDNNSRLCLTIHDEVRYLVPESGKYEAALALHVTNLLTRAFCVSCVGMCDLPQSIVFFSSVEIDVTLRKDSNDENTTPSNPFGLYKGYGVPPGETLDIYAALEKANKVGIRD